MHVCPPRGRLPTPPIGTTRQYGAPCPHTHYGITNINLKKNILTNTKFQKDMLTYLSSALIAAALLSALPLPPDLPLLPAEEAADKLFSIS